MERNNIINCQETGIIIIKNYGKINVKLAQMMDKKNITRNRLRTLTGIKYEVINRYYKAQNIERIDLAFFAKVCFVLDCNVSDLLEFEK